MAHLSREILDQRFAGLPAPPLEEGVVQLVVARPEVEARVTPEVASLTPEKGVAGDRWSLKMDPSPQSQVTIMRADVAEIVADGQPLTRFGDNLLVRLDISEQNLPAGTRLRVGTALCEVTPKPHTGCGKFSARFGPEAREWANSPENRDYRLRGMHVRVLEAGEVRPGDSISVLSRPPAQPSLFEESGAHVG